MSDVPLVNALGTVAGAVWMAAALYFQLLRARPVHPAYVTVLFLIGVALMMGSSAIAIEGQPGTVELLGIAANVLFIALGLAVWYGLERYADLEERKAAGEDARTCSR
jgi:CHASE2 domain-containing sensor protein